MRVLHVQKVKGIGGSERHLLVLLPALAARGIEVTACVLSTGPEADRFVAPLRDAGIATTVIPAGRDLSAGTASRLASHVRRARPDVVHTHLIHADLYGQLAARAAGAAGVLSMHSAHHFLTRPPWRYAEKLANGLARRTIAISHHVAGFLADAGLARPERIAVVHYGIDADHWPVEPARRIEARAAAGVDGERPVVGVASRLIDGKGIEHLVDAWPRVERAVPGSTLLVAGDGELREPLGRRARDRGAQGVRFLGFVHDVVGFMAACDVVAFPSLGEGFGLAALEAMAAGRPVVASDTHSLPEIVAHRETGLLVPPADPVALADALASLLTDHTARERMGGRARARVVSDFSVDGMAEATAGVYEEAVG